MLDYCFSLKEVYEILTTPYSAPILTHLLQDLSVLHHSEGKDLHPVLLSSCSPNLELADTFGRFSRGLSRPGSQLTCHRACLTLLLSEQLGFHMKTSLYSQGCKHHIISALNAWSAWVLRKKETFHPSCFFFYSKREFQKR